MTEIELSKGAAVPIGSETQGLPLRARFLSGVRWNLVAAIASQGGAYALSVVVARILGRETFGQYAIIQNTVLTAAAFAQLGTGLTATKYVAEFRNYEKQRAGRIVAMCLRVTAIMGALIAMTMFFAAVPIATHLLGDPHLSRGLMIAGGVLFFAGMNGCLLGVLAGLEAYRELAICAFLSTVGTLSVASLLARVGGLQGALVGLLVASAIQWTVLWRFAKIELSAHEIPILFTNAHLELGVLTGFALPAAVAGLISMPVLWIANTILVRQPNGFSQMALYGSAFSIRAFILFLPTTVNSVGTSLINNQRGAGKSAQFRRIFWTNLGIATITASLGAVFIALIAKLVLMPFGSGFSEAVPILRILLIAAVVEAVTIAAYQIIQAHGRMIFSLFFVALPRDASFLLLAIALVPRFGALGLAYSYTIAWCIALAIVAFTVYRSGVAIPRGTPRV